MENHGMGGGRVANLGGCRRNLDAPEIEKHRSIKLRGKKIGYKD